VSDFFFLLLPTECEERGRSLSTVYTGNTAQATLTFIWLLLNMCVRDYGDEPQLSDKQRAYLLYQLNLENGVKQD
jgi:hypothetical protein